MRWPIDRLPRIGPVPVQADRLGPVPVFDRNVFERPDRASLGYVTIIPARSPWSRHFESILLKRTAPPG